MRHFQRLVCCKSGKPPVTIDQAKGSWLKLPVLPCRHPPALTILLYVLQLYILQLYILQLYILQLYVLQLYVLQLYVLQLYVLQLYVLHSCQVVCDCGIQYHLCSTYEGL